MSAPCKRRQHQQNRRRIVVDHGRRLSPRQATNQILNVGVPITTSAARKIVLEITGRQRRVAHRIGGNPSHWGAAKIGMNDSPGKIENTLHTGRSRRVQSAFDGLQNGGIVVSTAEALHCGPTDRKFLAYRVRHRSAPVDINQQCRDRGPQQRVYGRQINRHRRHRRSQHAPALVADCIIIKVVSDYPWVRRLDQPLTRR